MSDDAPPIGRERAPNRTALEASVADLLSAAGIGAHPELNKTPSRVAEFWEKTLLSGYDENPAEILAKTLPTTGAGVVTLTGIPFHSVCPHHLVPYFGVAHVAYEPGEGIVGLGALERLVNALGRRLILQENLCEAIADALMQHLGAKGAACCLEARHLCLVLRGREPRSTKLYTRVARGSLQGRTDVLPPTGAIYHD